MSNAPKTQMTTPRGTVLPLMEYKRSAKQKDGSWKETITPYLQVAHRLVWFREERPHWTIDTALVSHDEKAQAAIYRATIKNSKGRIIATAIKSESRSDFGDYHEKAETGAIGRALALCGYGTQFAPEMEEGERLVDTPTQPGQKAKPQGQEQKPRQLQQQSQQQKPTGNEGPLHQVEELAKQVFAGDKEAFRKWLSGFSPKATLAEHTHAEMADIYNRLKALKAERESGSQKGGVV